MKMMLTTYSADAPTRAAIDHVAGPALIEFGTNWCGYCRAAQAPLAEVYAGHPKVRHFKIEDGPGRRLGRSFGVKLWPTLIFMLDGQEVARLVRPADAAEIAAAFAQIDPQP